MVLAQLPVQSHDAVFSDANHPLALGLLAAWARRALPGRVELSILGEVASTGGDAAILEALVDAGADLVGFGCFVWNLERSLALARALKRQRPKTQIVLGGPEVARDNDFLRACGGFDAAVLGEGEETFAELLAAVSARAPLDGVPGLLLPGPWRLTAPRQPIEPLDAIPSPFLDGVLRAGRRRTMALESVRGCPMRCAYCHYHKSFPRMRAFPLPRIEAELDWAKRAGIRELTFVDPCFARRARLEDFLELLGRGPGPDVRCELNAEDITRPLAKKLVRARVREAEIGLQTTNPVALRLAQRGFRRERFVEGVRHLRAEGIRVMLDVMVGLPGDRLEDVQRSVQFAVENDLFDDLKVYPLCVLPGTVFRAQARRLGLHYQPEPPYHVLQTATMSPEDIHQALASAEEIAGVDLFPIEIPRKSRRLVMQPGAPVRPLAPTDLKQALRIDLEDPAWRRRLPELRAALRPALAANPFTLLSFFLPPEPFPSPADIRALERLFPRAEHTLDRDWFATTGPSRSVQVFVSTPAATVRMPSSRIASPVLERQRVCWIAFRRPVSPRAEERFLDDLEKHFEAEPDVWFRVGSTG
ncbi:MAG TPA: radical SAM protein [Myxococcales bacterium]